MAEGWPTLTRAKSKRQQRHSRPQQPQHVLCCKLSHHKIHTVQCLLFAHRRQGMTRDTYHYECEQKGRGTEVRRCPGDILSTCWQADSWQGRSLPCASTVTAVGSSQSAEAVWKKLQERRGRMEEDWQLAGARLPSQRALAAMHRWPHRGSTTRLSQLFPASRPTHV